MATDSNNLKLARITAAKATAFASAVIDAGSVYWHEVQKRIRIGDGTTAGGLGVAMEPDLIQNGPTLQQTAIDKALSSLGVYDALEDLITEYGGTVPASLSETNTASTQNADDPWAEYD